VYQQVTRGMAIAWRRLYSADYAASEQVVKSRHFELGSSANRRVRSHCQDNETHSTQPTSVASEQLFSAAGQIYSSLSTAIVRTMKLTQLQPFR